MAKKQRNHSVVPAAAYLLLLAGYVISFWMVLKSGYRCDDCYNSNILGVTYLTGRSLWDLTIQAIKDWMASGRFFPFSSYTFFMYGVIRTRVAYKMAIVVATYCNSLLFGTYLYRVTKSRKLQWLFYLVFPALLPLNCEYNCAMYSYHMLMQMILLWVLLALLCEIRYLNGGKPVWLIGMALTTFLALGTYEVAFVYIVVFVLTALYVTKDKKRRIYAVLTPAAVYIFVIGITLVLRSQVVDGGYDGTSFGLNIREIGSTFARQLSASVPMVRYLVQYRLGFACSVKELLTIPWQRAFGLSFVALLITLLAILLVLHWWKKEVKKKDVTKELQYKKGLLSLIGLSFWCLPAVIISLSGKYQQEVQWGMGHLPSYLQAFGFVMLSVMLFIGLTERKGGKKTRAIPSALLLIVLSICLMTNQYMGYSTVEAENTTLLYPRQAMEEAVSLGLFDDMKEQEYSVATSDYVIDQLGVGEFYSTIAGRPVRGWNKGTFSQYLNEKQAAGHEFSREECAPVTNATFVTANKDGALVAKGSIVSAVTDSDTGALKSVYVDNLLVYVSGECQKWETIHIETKIQNQDETLSISRNEAKIIASLNQRGRQGDLYQISTKSPVMIHSITWE